MLIINEPLFEEVRSSVNKGLSSLSDLVKRLSPDDFQEYLLGWVLYCLGQMILKGNPIEGRWDLRGDRAPVAGTQGGDKRN